MMYGLLTKSLNPFSGHLEDIFDIVSDKNPCLFTNINIKHAYFQVFLDEESRPKTAFTVNGRQCEYCRMTMGLYIHYIHYSLSLIHI